MTKKTKYNTTQKSNNDVEIENRHVSTGQAYDLFLKQMSNKESTSNTDPCDKYCRSKRCQIACRFIKTKTFDINLHDWDKYRLK